MDIIIRGRKSTKMGINKDQQAFVQDGKLGWLLLVVTKIILKSYHQIEKERHLHTMVEMIQNNKVVTIHPGIMTIQCKVIHNYLEKLLPERLNDCNFIVVCHLFKNVGSLHFLLGEILHNLLRIHSLFVILHTLHI